MRGGDDAEPEPKKVATRKAPKGLGANMRASLPLLGVMICWNSLDRGGDLSPAPYALSDFKSGGKEKVGGRETDVIEFKVTERRDVITPPTSRIRLWLDAKTGLPVKLAMTTKGEDITATTDIFSEFVIDAKVEAKLFEVPK